MINEKLDNELEKIDDLNIFKEYRFILIDKGANIFIINSSFNNKEKEKNQNGEFTNLKNEISILNKKDLDKNIKLIDGIIFNFVSENKEILNKVIEYIYKIDKKIGKEKFFPKIFLCNKIVFKNTLNEIKQKEKILFNKMRNVIFLEKSYCTNNYINIAVNELIKMKIKYDNYENFINENHINEKQIINSSSKSKINLIKCLKCNQIYDILLDKFSNTIQLYCNNCKVEKKYNIFEFEKNQKEINCFLCKKYIKEINSINYCFKCHKNICHECSKFHSHEEKNNLIFPSNLINIICHKHNKLCNNYCNECNKNICIECELESHINHNTKIFDEKNICDLIKNQKENIEKEKQKYIKIREIINDCIKSLKEYFEKLIILKEQEIKIKEEMIEQFEILKYDDTMLKNIKNLEFKKEITIVFYTKDSWDKKLNNILEFFNEPIKIKKTKLCLEENLKGPYNLLQQVDDLRKTIIERESRMSQININETVTDLCPLHNYNGKNNFAVSFNNGLLKIYNDDFENRIPINIIDEFEKNEGINSLYKSYGKSLILIGNSKVKKINLSEDLKEYKILNEIEEKDQLFNMVLEIESFNAIITTNNLNQMIIYDSKNGKQLTDLTNKINSEEISKDILFIDKVSDNKIIMKQSNSINLVNLSNDRSIFDASIIINNTIDIDNNDDKENSTGIFSTQIKFQDSSWKILEFGMEGNNIEIKKNFLLKKDINYLGKINEQLLLLFNIVKNTIIVFDLISYFNIIEIPFKSLQKPFISFNLRKRNEILDLLFLCEEDYLVQYALNLKVGLIYEVAKIKIKLPNERRTILLDLNVNVINNDNKKEEENKVKNNIVKIVNLTKSNFLIITRDNNIYNLKKSD